MITNPNIDAVELQKSITIHQEVKGEMVGRTFFLQSAQTPKILDRSTLPCEALAEVTFNLSTKKGTFQLISGPKQYEFTLDDYDITELKSCQRTKAIDAVSRVVYPILKKEAAFATSLQTIAQKSGEKATTYQHASPHVLEMKRTKLEGMNEALALSAPQTAVTSLFNNLFKAQYEVDRKEKTIAQAVVEKESFKTLCLKALPKEDLEEAQSKFTQAEAITHKILELYRIDPQDPQIEQLRKERGEICLMVPLLSFDDEIQSRDTIHEGNTAEDMARLKQINADEKRKKPLPQSHFEGYLKRLDLFENESIDLINKKQKLESLKATEPSGYEVVKKLCGDIFAIKQEIQEVEQVYNKKPVQMIEAETKEFIDDLRLGMVSELQNIPLDG